MSGNGQLKRIKRYCIGLIIFRERERWIILDKATPFLWIKNTAEAIEFYKKAFDAVEKYRLTEPEGKVAHAEITIGGANISIAGEYPEFDILGRKLLVIRQLVSI